jgi:hypothetical protein
MHNKPKYLRAPDVHTAPNAHVLGHVELTASLSSDPALQVISMKPAEFLLKATVTAQGTTSGETC